MAIRQFLNNGVLALLLVLPASGGSATGSDRPLAFEQLLNEAGLQVNQSEQFSDLAPAANSVLPYEYALRHASGQLEVRFIVRPLSRIQIEYNDPHNAAPEPNHLFPLLFESMTNQLSNGRDFSSRTFAEAEALEKFNAHWAAAAAFDIDPEFGGGFSNAFLLAMHKNETADAYTLFLYNDPQQAKILINESLSIMSFEP